MRKNKKLILISSILATTAIAVVPAISIVNNINTVNVIDSQLDNLVQNNEQVESSVIMTINSNECNVGSTKATEWMGITSGGLVNFEIDDAGLTATVKNVSAPTIASSNLKIPGSIIYNTKTYTVTTIGIRAFRSCSGLTGTLTIPASVTTISDWAFDSCYGLTALDLTNATSLKTIAAFAFMNCSGLTGALTIPASVTSIDAGAFGGCKFTSIKIDSGNQTYVLANNLGEKCYGVIMKDQIKFDFTQQASSQIIENLLFGSLEIPASVITIGEGAFTNCSGLTGVIFPASVTSIGKNAFNNCSDIADITVLATTPPNVADDSFNIFTATLHVPADSENLYKSDANWSKFKIDPIPTPPIPDPVKPTDNLNLPLIIGATVGGATVILAAIAGVVTYVAKRNKKLENK